MAVSIDVSGATGLVTAIWLCPVAFTLHVLEELSGFTPWARRHINPNFTQHQYLRVHLAGIAAVTVTALILWLFPNRTLVYVFFTLLLTPSFFCNVFFHAGASVAYRFYSPGLITALLIYIPLYALLCRLAFASDVLSVDGWIVSTTIASLFHAIEVRHNVFRFRPEPVQLIRYGHKSRMPLR